MDSEKTIYQASPSQILNLSSFIISLVLTAGIVAASILLENTLILVLLLIPVAYMLLKWLNLRATRLTLTDQRIIVTEGVFNKVTHETELYRVRDTSVIEPFFFRLFGLGTIIVYTTDEAIATHTFTAYEHPHWIKDQIRNFSELCRQRKRWGNDNVLLHDHLG
ncbi:MAG TPA: PH domain-containing protein [Flavisolibacter sp.]|nr:PH domain-containing protein [Flavisolibacter sp.]